ncbi:Low density lipoprotein receptor adapter protein 1 [Saguinus oedipus]|uniref:Low density lipoprotein receptor adapter protein 1 n=1 Tax=Saguinus oedipus TaxID=9490 RepID=A0ABQ9V9Z3_SAGOE|nr:Low density lipoprotein receptor adapter protein 1 [Saguinus oedipus]
MLELPENWTDTRETLLEGMLFSLKYLGMTLVEQPKGEELSAAAIKRIVATAKASGKKLQKVTLKVSPRGIILTDNLTNQLIENVSIYRPTGAPCWVLFTHMPHPYFQLFHPWPQLQNLQMVPVTLREMDLDPT